MSPKSKRLWKMANSVAMIAAWLIFYHFTPRHSDLAASVRGGMTAILIFALTDVWKKPREEVKTERKNGPASPE